MFLEEREFIFFSEQLNNNSIKMKNPKNKRYFVPLNLYAMCNFDISLLPIKLNLPMVYPPQDWVKTIENPYTIDDLCGGYLSRPTGGLYFRYNLLTSHNYDNLYIIFEKEYEQLLSVMNVLQKHPFEINREVLSFIQKNRNSLEEEGLLMPSFLASLNLNDASNILRKCYLMDESINKLISFPNLFSL